MGIYYPDLRSIANRLEYELTPFATLGAGA
jgi:hypothetical protein